MSARLIEGIVDRREGGIVVIEVKGEEELKDYPAEFLPEDVRGGDRVLIIGYLWRHEENERLR